MLDHVGVHMDPETTPRSCKMIPPNQKRFGVDHPVVSVRHHHDAVSKFSRLGFAPSPTSYHPWGSVLALMMFENNFIEVIGIL